MDTRPRDPETLRKRGILQKLLGRLNLRFPGLFALLAAVTLLDIFTPDVIPFFPADEIVLALLTMIFALWKERRTTVVTTATVTTSGGAQLPAAQPPPPPDAPEGR